MSEEQIEKEVLWWNRAALLVPVCSTILLFVIYQLGLAELYILFYIALAMYITTAVTWWWWTMKNIIYLSKLLFRTTQNIGEVVNEVKYMKDDLKIAQQSLKEIKPLDK